MYVDRRQHPLVDKAIKACAPKYTGVQVYIVYGVRSTDMRSAWSDGHRTYFSIVRLTDLEHLTMPESHAVYSPKPELAKVEIPDGFVCVAHHYAGTKQYLTIYVPGEAGLLESGEKLELTEEQILVLAATASLKSSYGGVSDYRAHELWQKHRIRRTRTAEIRGQLQEMKLLDKRNAITIAGRNALESSGKRFW